jgi:pimeloyl-ACP methyl ester carboxylesterase
MEGRGPTTRYARAGQVSIAYQIVGGGTRDLVFVPGWVSNVEEYWTNASCRRFLERLASFSRLVVFDKRGTGLSDRVERVPHLEERIEDITAVLSAVRSPSTALLGFSEGGAIASLFAATYPKRVSALVLYAANAKCTQTADYPCGYTPEQAESMFTGYIEHQ